VVFLQKGVSPEDLGLWKDEQIEISANQFIVSQHSVPEFNWRMPEEKQAVLLLGMAIKTGCHRGGWETVAPSAIPFQDTDTMPVALDKSGIEKVIADFAATIRSVDTIDGNSRSPWLFMHQFLSPLSNRTDAYGGFENRIRLTLEVLEAVQSEWPKTCLCLCAFRLPTGQMEVGMQKSLKLSTILKEKELI
jgi:2,4-dienoyl-CoA reductase-like NADH-dependent reductase (Old Yellow Enzyme family)